MEQIDHQKYFKLVVERIFNNWQNLKLAVEHGMGGRNGQQMAIQIMEYMYQYCIGNEDITPCELQEILEDLMNEQFNTICDDGTIEEICRNLLRYKMMIMMNQYNEIEAELNKLPQNTNWLRESVGITICEDNSCSESSSDADSDNNDAQCMDVEASTNFATTSNFSKELNQSESYDQNTVHPSEMGWTVVRNKKNDV